MSNPIEELRSVAGRAKALMTYAEGQYAETGNPEWLALTGRAINEFARQLEVLAKLMPQVAAQYAAPDPGLDADIEALLAQIASGAPGWMPPRAELPPGDAVEPAEAFEWDEGTEMPSRPQRGSKRPRRAQDERLDWRDAWTSANRGLERGPRPS